MKLIKNSNFFILSLLFASLVWFSESLIHTWLFKTGSMAHNLFHPEWHELWMRVTILLVGYLFGFYGWLMRARYEKTSNELRLSEIKYHTMADFTYDWEYWIGRDGKYVYISPSCERITGYRPDEFVADPGLLERITLPTDRALTSGHIHSVQENLGEHSFDFRIVTRNGEERWVNHMCRPIRLPDGTHWGHRGSNRDITQRKRAEEDLKKQKEALEISEKNIKYFSGKILSVREEEKRKLSRDLHDELGTMTVALGSSLLIAKDEIKDGNLSMAVEKIVQAEKTLKQTVEKIKKIATDLRPLNLDIVGLSEALKKYIADVQNGTKIMIGYRDDWQEKKIDPDIAIVLYRIVQEALSNILKHSRAQYAEINLCYRDELIKLNISDDGKGFDIASINDRILPGLGIRGMRERVESLGGQFLIRSIYGKGTKIDVALHVKNQQSEPASLMLSNYD